MESGDFLRWLSGIERLSPGQREQALAALSSAREIDKRRVRGDAADEAGRSGLESRGCPHCAGREIVAFGSANGAARYRCKTCARTFNAATNTPMARLRKKERWADNAQAMIEATSVAKAAERCGVHYTTAFRWRHRFLGSLSLDKPKRLAGIVEADETFILESSKGRPPPPYRKARKRGGKARHPGLFFESIPIFVARDRQGATLDAVLANVDAASVALALDGVVTPDNRLICDGGKAILAFARKAKIPVHVVPAPGKPSPEAPDIHINNVNAYHGRLKEWMRRFHGVATKNLPNYLGWRRTLEALGDDATPRKWINAAFGMGPYQQLTL